jgi:hypothetical protein
MGPNNNKCLHRSVCQTNNQAAGELVDGNPDAAIRGFRAALEWLRNGHIHGHDSGCSEAAEHGKITEQQTCRMSAPTSLFRLTFCSDDEKVSPFNSFCYYNRTMVVHEDESDETLLCMVVLFNLAITCHHFGLANQGREELLRKALALYKMVLAVTQQHSNITGNDSVVRLLLLATFSNMGHIYSHFTLTYEEKVCQQQLFAVLTGTCIVLDAEEARKFSLNAHQKPEMAPAA